ncbi:CMRF35-like molecule 9 [Sardina pilchardus]|uniref:CMRF35-like molecule 9 n=1 Tax=Sardina pilchardus TaxID=27697 RepID=UPI002E0DCD05
MTSFLLLILMSCLESGSGVHAIDVTGYVGDEAVFRCPYVSGYEEHYKYLCRGSCPIIGHKDIPIETEAGQTKAITGRFSLHDDTTAGVFTVTITGLTAKDSGQYWCGIKTGFGKRDVYTKIQLQVIQPVSEHPTDSVSTEKGNSNTSVLVGTIVGPILILIAVCALLRFHLQKRKKASQTLDCVSTITSSPPQSSRGRAAESYHPALAAASEPVLDPSNSAACTTPTTTPSQIEPKYLSLKPSSSASPESVYQTMTAAPVRKAKAAMSSSVRSVDNEYITMGPPLSRAVKPHGRNSKRPC